jgi:hypothetical protein
MWTRGLLVAGLLAAASSLSPASALTGQWVNVSAEWCNGTCSEGHDDAACLCEYEKGQSPYLSSSWNHCVGVPCCAWATTFCSVGDPDCACWLDDGSDPERMRQWCFPSNPIVTCTKASVSGSYSCSYDCSYESSCGINYPGGGANWIYINSASGQQCTGENETGFWSFASWWSFLSGANTCTLGWQTPWDDYPLENEICE